MVLVAKPMFLGMENHLGLFSEASDQPEGHEQGGGTVGGQEALQGVKFLLHASEHAKYLVPVTKPMFWGMENHLGPFSEASDQPEGQELGARDV